MIWIYMIYMFMFSIIIMMMSLLMYLEMKGLIFEWLMMSLSSMKIEFLIYIDWMSSMFISIVLLISSMILMYSVIYMEGEKFFKRYLYLLLLFVFSMIIMILSPNMVSIMFGWDGLGLVSFCLVIFYQNYMSYNSGMLTVLLNRLGDVMILMVISLMMIYGSWSMIFMSSSKMILFFILIAGMTKSAQIPFSSWLPSAMAAPTPISALVHSSTLVTAGVYLLIRFSKMLLMFSGLMKILLFLSVLTMFMSGLMASFEYDLKKIIALSTLSQLGLMMMILSVGFPMLSYYHLLTHAIFKSLLFMGAGSVIHLMMNNQDIRLMGGLSDFIPFTMMSFQLTLMALCGFPFFSGFYSKDLIMEIMYMKEMNFLIFFMIVISLVLTVMYSLRLMYYMFLNEKKNLSLMYIYESKEMVYSMMILLMLSVFSGSLLNWMFFFDQVTFIEFKFKILTVSMVMMGVVFMGLIVLFMKYMDLLMEFFMKSKVVYLMKNFLSSMWFLNYLYKYIVFPVLMTSEKLYYLDKVWMEYYSSGVVWSILKMMESGFNKKYKMYMFIHLLMVVILLSWMMI
uniref:NADH dehydrogenase subunit 5 n=1 Tax=Buniapone amblyops TaxID=613574 RepID=UPI002A804F24|nr:NADH dehydrogenase subunit 5 [Buniapone amblyops]WON66601.1 NADH dehydrogenase subunit 5 [Buniapone amblyops]